MKKTSYLNLFIPIFLLTIIFMLNACNNASLSPDTSQPTPNVDATVNAQVQATIAATNNNSDSSIVEEDTERIVTDTNPPVFLPFRDDFDSGLDSNWRILNSNPVVVNGKLGAARGEDIYLEIGNSDLRDYTLAFDVVGGKHPWGGYSSNLYLTLTPSLQVQLSSADLDSRVDWRAFADNEWDEIGTTRFKESETANFKITVTGNTYTVHANGQIVSELVYGQPRDIGAPLLVQIHGDNIWLDNFSIH